MSSAVISPPAPPVSTATLTSVPYRQPNSLRVGRCVRVLKGRLAGLSGCLLDAPASGGCLIEIPLLGKGVYLRVDADLLEPLDAGADELH